jgi:Protein of unknown function (DUF1566)
MRGRMSQWLSGIGAILLIGGLLTGCGSSDDAAIAQSAPADLSGVTQNWDKNLPTGQRFAVLSAFANAAVLDKNTGLVWEKAPDTTIKTTWPVANTYCVNRTVGSTAGWRLPSVFELMSLLDLTLPAPFVPTSVFTGIQSVGYWSATAAVGSPTAAWTVNFNIALATANDKTGVTNVWCVRGGHNDRSDS